MTNEDKIKLVDSLIDQFTNIIEENANDYDPIYFEDEDIDGHIVIREFKNTRSNRIDSAIYDLSYEAESVHPMLYKLIVALGQDVYGYEA